MLRNRKPDGKIISDINITPLTDVMLVLLIIFMVTATFFVAEPAMRVSLPSAVTGTTEAEDTRDIAVTISETGEVGVNGKMVRMQDLVQELLNAAREIEGKKVVRIRGDKDVRYGAIIYVMDAARLVGLRHVALATEKESELPSVGRE